MPRIIVGVSILLIVCVLTVSAAILIGYQQPAPEQVAVLHLTDCELPCWIGIVPGKTTIVEARRRIKEVYGNLPGYTLSETDTGFSISGMTGVDGGEYRGLSDISLNSSASSEDLIVKNITLEESIISTNNPSIGEIYARLGPPTYSVIPYSGTEIEAALLFPNRRVELLLSMSKCGDVSMRLIVGEVIIYAQMPETNQWRMQPQTWRGFDKCMNIYASVQ